MGHKYQLICGNVVDGLTFTGPFDTAEEANDYADTHFRASDWVCSKIYTPEDDSAQRIMQLEDALRRAWDWADKRKAPQDLSDSVHDLLRGVPDRRDNTECPF